MPTAPLLLTKPYSGNKSASPEGSWFQPKYTVASKGWHVAWAHTGHFWRALLNIAVVCSLSVFTPHLNLIQPTTNCSRTLGGGVLWSYGLLTIWS